MVVVGPFAAIAAPPPAIPWPYELFELLADEPDVPEDKVGPLLITAWLAATALDAAVDATLKAVCCA